MRSERIKRAFDLLTVFAGLILFGPIMAAIALLILIDDGRPIFFLQERLGRGRKTFLIFKFRTMRDGKVTRFGRILRQNGLDELPQILNIVSGEMSVVGPRPLTRADIERLGWNDGATERRWSVKPGLTGLAQVHGGQGALRSRELDLDYVRRSTFALDLGLIALSFIINTFGKRRTRKWILGHRD